MKIRTGFVSNSSSSSFIIAEKDLKKENFNAFKYEKYDDTILEINPGDIVQWIKRKHKKKMKAKDIITEIVISSFFYDDVFDRVVKKYLKERNIELNWEKIAKDEKGRALKDVMVMIFYTILEVNLDDFFEDGDEIVFLRFLLEYFNKDVEKYLEKTYCFVFEDFVEVLKEDDPLKAIASFKQWFSSYLYDFTKLSAIDMKEVAEKMQKLVLHLEKFVKNIDKEKVAYHLVDDVIEFDEYTDRVINGIKELALKDNEEVYIFEVYGSGDGWQDNIGSPMYEVGKEVWDKNNRVIYYED